MSEVMRAHFWEEPGVGDWIWLKYMMWNCQIISTNIKVGNDYGDDFSKDTAQKASEHKDGKCKSEDY